MSCLTYSMGRLRMFFRKPFTFFAFGLVICLRMLSGYAAAETLHDHSAKTGEAAEADGLYDPRILALYNSTTNEETLFSTDNYQTYYFNGLNLNKGNNTKGSCGFVAMAMLLSFWDTYWDDGIIEEQYEASTQLETKHIDLYAEAPGVMQEPSAIANAASVELYDSYIHEYADSYFHFKLIDLFEANIESRAPGEYSLVYQDYVRLFNFYVYDYLGYSKSRVEVIHSNADVRNKTIELIKSGIPVKLGIGDHAVVAYDYDEENDDIYCNFGWGPNASHVTIEQMGYSEYQNLVAFDFKDDHHNHHSDNYRYTDINGDQCAICSCWACVPDEIAISEGNYLDKTPTYKWDSLIDEKWHRDIGLRHTFSILDVNRRELFRSSNVSENSCKLTREEWCAALDATGSVYYAYVGFESNGGTGWDDCYCMAKFDEPTDYAVKIQIKPSEWGFEERYWFADESGDGKTEYRETTVTKNGLIITAQRLRCGYIEEQYVNLSPRREGAGLAYLRLEWNMPVFSYMFGASLWSAKENFDGVAFARVKSLSGEWQSVEDADFNLLSLGLSTTRSNIKRFHKKHLEGIFGLEFRATSSAVGERNKGRICLDDIVLNTSLFDTGFISAGYASV